MEISSIKAHARYAFLIRKKFLDRVGTTIRVYDGISNLLEHSPQTLPQTYGLVQIVVLRADILTRCAYTGGAGRQPERTSPLEALPMRDGGSFRLPPTGLGAVR